VSEYVNFKEQPTGRARFLSNIVSLLVLQGANYLLPLLTIPYLVRVLGPEYYGLVAFAAATTTYFTLITDYGFNLSATKQVSIHRLDREKIKKIYSSVMMVRFILLVASFFLFLSMVFIFDKFRTDYDIYLVSFLVVIGQFLFPVWLFQGLEVMKFIAILNILAKSIFTAFVFLLVTDDGDYLLVPFLTAAGSIMAGIIAQLLVIYHLKVRFSFPVWGDVKEQFVDGWHIFSSSISISMYTASTTFVLGIFTNNQVVGFYSAAEKITQALKGLYQPVSQAMYPIVSSRMAVSQKSGIAFVQKLSNILAAFMFIICSMLFIFSEEVVIIILGDMYIESVPILRIMAYLPFVIVLSNMYGVQVMVNVGMKVQFSRILMTAAVLGLSLSIITVPTYGATASASVSLLTEIFVTLCMALYLWRKL
jgi:PST family polysaccharide transporter